MRRQSLVILYTTAYLVSFKRDGGGSWFLESLELRGGHPHLRLGDGAVDVEEPNDFSISGDFRDVLLSDIGQGHLYVIVRKTTTKRKREPSLIALALAVISQLESSESEP
jgi:hypothetical protein